MDDRGILGAPLLAEQRAAHLEHLLQLPSRAQALQLPELRLPFGQGRCGVWLQEEVDGLPGLARDLLQGFHRRLRAALLDKVDGGPGELATGHLRERQAGLPARLLDGPGTDGHSLATAAIPAAEHGGECTAVPGF